MTKKIKSIIGLFAATLIVGAAILIVSAFGNRGSSIVPANPVNVSAGSLTLLAPIHGTFDAGQIQNIKWISQGPVGSAVQVALIRKISDNPARYELVRVITPAKANDGSAVWVPALTDIGSSMSIEIGCKLSANSCAATKPSSGLAVINDGRYLNTANIFRAIEQMNNDK